LDPELDIFKDVFEDDELAIYETWLSKSRRRKVRSLDRKHIVNLHHLVVSQLYEHGDNTREHTLACLREHASGFIDGAISTPLREHLSDYDGKYSEKCVTEEVRSQVAGTVCHSNSAERYYGVLKLVAGRWGRINVERNANGQAVAMINKQLHPKSDKDTLLVSFEDLTHKEQVALVEFARRANKHEIKVDNQRFADVLKKLNESAEEELEKAIEKEAKHLQEALR
jgi:hypothetical protein